MSPRERVLVALTAAVLVAATGGADTIVVTPSTLNGWVTAARQGTGSAAPEVGFVDGPNGPPNGVPPLGLGSLHMETQYSDGNPLQKVYVGTNAYSGTALADISSMRYWCYLTYRGYFSSGQPLGQPPMLELITDSGSTTQQRRFWFYPFGKLGRPSDPDAQLSFWQEFDCLAADGYWVQGNTSGTDWNGNWDWIKNKYAGLKLRTPLVGDYTDGYPGGCPTDCRLANETGTSLSFKIGAGRASDCFYADGCGWWRESASIDACVDSFTIGIGGVETVYDFDMPERRTVVIAGKSTYDGIMAAASPGFRWMVYGVVVADVYYNSNRFTLDDKSGRTVRVECPTHGATPGDFVMATGYFRTFNPPTVVSVRTELENFYQ